MRLISILVIFALAAFSFAACSSSSSNAAAPLSTAEIQQAVQSGKKSVIFFINPSGYPCRMQDEILQKLHSDRKGSFNLVPVVTMNYDHQQAFYDYGIRSLPAMVLLDSKGGIAKHFPPGIQPYEIVAQELDNTK
ncbi:MAG: thioredoxin family protein [Dissulfurispiraceae bacterium]|jgi:thioredoxin-like negative regulator of GroEL|nr:thioredoxin family protein [Dissulfurispiraceae bacterium]